MTADVDIFLTFLYSLFFLSSFLLVHTSYNHISAYFKKKGFFLHSLTICQLPVLSRSELGGTGGGVENEQLTPLSSLLALLAICVT